MGEHTLLPASEISNGERLLVELEGRELGIFNIQGKYFAYLNWCPHQGGPLCEGSCTGRQTANYDRETRQVELEWVEEGEILACPWHDWEFDLKTGENIPRSDIQLPSYDVEVKDGILTVYI
jgi:nitrite reductase/ring-hydroxylating ferredoxin subunit